MLVEIHNLFNSPNFISGSVVTLGVFDGIHLGHRKIISILNKKSFKANLPSVLLSFYPYPVEIINPNKKIKYLNTFKEKIYLLENLGIDNFIICSFNKCFSNISSKLFIRDFLLERLNMKYFIFGYDHTFGKDKKGNYKILKYFSSFYNFKIKRLKPYKIDSNIVSSSSIRKSLLRGDINWVNKALGYEYMISGKIVKGNNLGSKIGFPTANIKINSKKLIPKIGVYAVKVIILNKVYIGMLNIGFRPTISNCNDIKIEVHIINFNLLVYNEKIFLFIIKRIRNERKFNTIYDLINQLKLDKIIINNYFK